MRWHKRAKDKDKDKDKPQGGSQPSSPASKEDGKTPRTSDTAAAPSSAASTPRSSSSAAAAGGKAKDRGGGGGGGGEDGSETGEAERAEDASEDGKEKGEMCFEQSGDWMNDVGRRELLELRKDEARCSSVQV